MGRGIEVDWVFIQVNTVRRLLAVLVLVAVAGALVLFARSRINPPPDVKARRAIERAQAAQQDVRANPLPESWVNELEQAERQLAEAQDAYASERWDEASSAADSAFDRFERLLRFDQSSSVGAGQLVSVDGRVAVQRAGKSEWQNAAVHLPVFNGDFVKSGQDGAAEILFHDNGTVYRMAPNSLLEIQQGTTRGQDRGEIKLEVGQVNVLTAGRPSTVTTDSTRTEVDSDSQVALGVDEESRGTTVTAFRGAAMVRSAQGAEVRVGEREQVATNAEGAFSQKLRIPDPPTPMEPANNASFDLKGTKVAHLKWQARKETVAVHLQVSRSKHFSADQVEVDVGTLRKNSARLELVGPGTYFWRIASLGAGGTRSEWSEIQRFRAYTQDRESALDDTSPPELTVKPAQQLGHMFIVEGTVEAGATVTVNGERVEVDGMGNFSKTIEFRDNGWNDIIVAAIDPSGNKTERREKVNVEVY